MKLTKVGKIVLVLTILFISLLVFLWWNNRKDNISVHKMESNDFFDIKIDYDKTGVDEIDKKCGNN